MRASRTFVAALVLAAFAIPVAPAAAADPDAPAGAPANWLPPEPWVGEHWMPFSEAQLERELGIDRHGLQSWLSGEPP